MRILRPRNLGRRCPREHRRSECQPSTEALPLCHVPHFGKPALAATRLLAKDVTSILRPEAPFAPYHFWGRRRLGWLIWPDCIATTQFPTQIRADRDQENKGPRD